MAIEDGAVLGNLLSRLTHPSQLPALLQAYEDLRLPRTAETQNQSRLNQKIFHLPDGTEQEVRDADMRRAAEVELRRVREGGAAAEAFQGSANQWADRAKNDAQFGYDADEEVDRWWAEEGMAMLRSLNGVRTFSPDSSTIGSSDGDRSVTSLSGKKSFWKKLVGGNRKVEA